MKPLELNNALLRAAGTGDIVEVQRLVGGGADVNCRGRNGITPVIEAAEHLAVKEYLIGRGADVNYTGFSEGTALMLAAGAGAAAVVQRLIELGAEFIRVGPAGNPDDRWANRWRLRSNHAGHSCLYRTTWSAAYTASGSPAGRQPDASVVRGGGESCAVVRGTERGGGR